MLKNKWINYAGVAFLVIVIFIIGFYFGYKNAKSNQTGTTIINTSDNSAATVSTQIQALQVDGVMWIKAGQDPVCPQSHPVKGTFSDNFGNYYTKDNTRYDRIKPDICFATEDYARDTAGFIKKF
jgi:hypothetical protein